MTGVRYEIPANPPGPPVHFVPAGPTSRKVMCAVCGRTGWGQAGDASSVDIHAWGRWQYTCLQGHLPCPRCGQMLIVLLSGRARKHTHCPGRMAG